MTQSQAVLLTIDEVAALTKMSRRTVLERILEWNEGDPAGLPAINVGGSEPRGRRWRVDPDTLDDWLRGVRSA